MCFICIQVDTGAYTEYDASLLSVLHEHTIGDKHADQLRQALKHYKNQDDKIYNND